MSRAHPTNARTRSPAARKFNTNEFLARSYVNNARHFGFSCRIERRLPHDGDEGIGITSSGRYFIQRHHRTSLIWSRISRLLMSGGRIIAIDTARNTNCQFPSSPGGTNDLRRHKRTPGSNARRIGSAPSSTIVIATCLHGGSLSWIPRPGKYCASQRKLE